MKTAMKTKLVYLFVMLCLVVMTIVTTPSRVSACSGDDCGCGLANIACQAECPPDPDPNHYNCVRSCLHECLACSVACCA